MINALWGRGPSDVFAAGSSGTILLLESGAWRTLLTEPSADTVYALWGTALAAAKK